MKARLAGGVVIAFALSVGAVDTYHAAKNFSKMGPLPPGESIPDFRVRMLDGGEFTADQLQGKVTVLTFWATWCPACRSELTDLDELDDDYANKGDVQFLAVNWEGSNVPPAARKTVAARYRKSANLGLPVAYDDGSMAKAVRVGPIPHTVILGRHGRLRYIHQGRVTSATIAEEIEALLAE